MGGGFPFPPSPLHPSHEAIRVSSNRVSSRPFEAIRGHRGHSRPFSSRIRGHSRPFKAIRVKRISHRGHSRPFGTFFGPGKSTKKSVIESHRGHSRPFPSRPFEAIRGHSRDFFPAFLSKKMSHRGSSRLIERFFLPAFLFKKISHRGSSRDFFCLPCCPKKSLIESHRGSSRDFLAIREIFFASLFVKISAEKTTKKQPKF